MPSLTMSQSVRLNRALEQISQLKKAIDMRIYKITFPPPDEPQLDDFGIGELEEIAAHLKKALKETE